MENVASNSIHEDEQSNAGAPYDATKYAQIDYWLTSTAWRHTVSNVESRVDIHADSNHVILEARIHAKMTAVSTSKQENTKRYYKPSNEQWIAVNQEIKTHISSVELNLTGLTSIMKQAANNLDEVSAEKKKNYVSKETWETL